MSHSLPPAPRILICRLSHIGDCILTLPMLAALRRKWPQAWIAWAMEKPTPSLLDGHPDLDEIITIPKGWLKSPRTIWRLRRELRQRQFDVAVDPQSICKSAALGWISGAATRVGFAGEHGRELSRWFNNRLVQVSTTHLVDRSIDLLLGLDIPWAPPTFDLPIDVSSQEFADRFTRDSGLTDQRWLVINPGASWASKRWENHRFGEVARRVQQECGVRSVVTWAGDEEADMAREVVANATGSATMAPSTTLRQLAALLSRACLFIGCDTGPLHLAAATGTTCVGLYGPTRPQDSGAWGTQHHALQNRYHAGSCRERRRATNAAMRTITVDQVVRACSQVLASGDQQRERTAA